MTSSIYPFLSFFPLPKKTVCISPFDYFIIFLFLIFFQRVMCSIKWFAFILWFAAGGWQFSPIQNKKPKKKQSERKPFTLRVDNLCQNYLWVEKYVFVANLEHLMRPRADTHIIHSQHNHHIINLRIIKFLSLVPISLACFLSLLLILCCLSLCVCLCVVGNFR